jgi:ribulose-5-phosphate 4-epimerase/fuculose-1-phosphate aldolase
MNAGGVLVKHSNIELRRTLLQASHVLDHYELVHGYGHVSARAEDGETMLITPRKAPGLLHSPREILHADLDGRQVPGRGTRGISSRSQLPLEFYLHTEVYRARPDVRAIARVHGKFAQVLSIVRRSVRPVHELSVVLGPELPIYDSPGLISSRETGQALAKSLGAAGALLMRGNGQMVTGQTVEEAVVNALHMETSAELQWRALQIGEPAWITGDEFSGELSKLAKRKYEAVLRPWEYYVSKSKNG